MTNELEKQFFDTFGIKPRQTCKVTSTCNNFVNYNDCNGCNSYKYPQITDHILLELICIVLNTFQTFEVYRIMDIDSLKEKILKLLILAQDDVYSQVRTLFKDG